MDVLWFWVAAAAFIAAWYIARGMPIGSHLLYAVGLFSTLAVVAATAFGIVEWPSSGGGKSPSLEEQLAAPETETETERAKPAKDLDCEYTHSGIPHDGIPEVSCVGLDE